MHVESQQESGGEPGNGQRRLKISKLQSNESWQPLQTAPLAQLDRASVYGTEG